MLLLHVSGSIRTIARCGAVVTLVAAVTRPATAATLVVNAGGDLQAVIDAAQPGDTIVLQPGATYAGNFVLPVKYGSVEITIRTASDSRLPEPGRRLDPVLHGPLLAKIRSGNTLPALATTEGTHHWRLELLEFQANVAGYGEIIRLGRGGGVEQSRLDQVPHQIVIDRCYIHGDPLLGQKRGIALNSASTTIVNSHISDIKGVGFDTQAIGGWNGPGPYVIENNHLEGAGENVLFGGADPSIQDLVPSDIRFRGNLLTKPRSWNQPIIPAPAGLSTAVLGGGTLPPGTYAYRLVARRHIGQWNMGTSAASVEIAAEVTAANGAVRVAWSPVPHAVEYRVYGRAGSAQTEYWTVSGTTFVDTGAAGTAGTPPSDGSRWTVKNIFEVKNGRRLLIEDNIFEQSWTHGQTGVAVLFTPRNQDGHAPWSGVSDVTFRYNIVRHAGAGVNVNGQDTNHVSQVTRNVLVKDNLFYDLNARDGSGRFLSMAHGPSNVTIEHNTIIHTGTLIYVYGKKADGTYETVSGFRFANNLARHNTYGIMGEAGGGIGAASILTYFFDLTAVIRNVIAGAAAVRYPDNFVPPAETFLAEFMNAAADDYRLRPESPYKGAGTDGRDLGADIERLASIESAVLQGVWRDSPGTSSTPPSPPRNLRIITTP